MKRLIGAWNIGAMDEGITFLFALLILLCYGDLTMYAYPSQLSNWRDGCE